MVTRSAVVLLVLVVIAGWVRAEGEKEVVVESAEELKGIKAKKVTWEKDGTKMVFIPATEFLMGTKASTLDEIIFFSLYQIFNLILNE